jgi:hypothetical protein
MNPVHGALNLLGLCARTGQRDQRLGVELAAKAKKLVCSETEIV